MTDAMPRPPANPQAPEVTVAAVVQAAAGAATSVPVRVHHRGRVPADIRVTVLGLDSRWAPEPLDLGTFQPGEAAEVTLTLVPERGALGARYPFVVAVEATPRRGTPIPVMGIAEATLAVDSAERISMSIQPPTPRAVFGKKFRVEITNPGSVDRPLQLLSESAAGASVRLGRDEVTVPAQRTVSVKGRVRIRRPTILGGENAHTFTVTAQGTGAPEYAEATVRSGPLIRRGARMAIGLVLVVALWVSLAVVFIPKISDAFKPNSLVGAPATVTSAGPVASGAPGAPSSAGSGGSGAGGSGSGSSGAGGSGGGSGPGGAGGSSGSGSAQAAGYQLTGTITGPAAKGTAVTLTPTSLLAASDAKAASAPGSSASTVNALRSITAGAVGKVFGQAVSDVGDGTATRRLITKANGEFAIAGIQSPGYYLLTLAKAGFQTQRFLINSADLASPNPMKVALLPGNGSLSGTVTGPDGPIGAATITITDGTVSLQTSSVSASASASGTPGTWRADNLSTPGSYLITATAPGYGGSSTLVTLGPKGSKKADLTLKAGQASIVGTVSGADQSGHTGGLGGITVTATAGKVTRTATTVTSQSLRGSYILPNMPTPGEYTLTISGDGFLTQTRTVTLTEGVGSATVDATLSRADSSVSGTVTGLDAKGKPEGGLVGVGLTLTSSTTTLKTMTTSGDSAGSYQFTGVPPGTYVLTASQYGRTPASATIELSASDSKTVDLSLTSNVGSELPATSHIRGQVVDSRTGGPLTCDRTAVPIAAKDCVATVTVSAPKDPSDPSKGSVTYSVTSTSALNFVYTVPSLDDPSHTGLPPGLYTVRVSAPGYEATTTHVQVAQDQIAPAPQVSLPVLGIISGTLTTRVGTPAAPTCVVAVPAANPISGSLPTSCQPDSDGVTCAVSGLGTFPCGLTSMGGSGQAAAGTYQVRGLTHGRYQILVIPQDREFRYVVSSPPIVELDLGGDGQFNAVLDRLGRVQLTVYLADRQSGALSPAKAVPLTVTDSSNHTRSAGVTLDDGTATITGLNGSYTVAATANDTTAAAGSGPVGLNQTVNMTLVIAAPVGPVVGRVTTNNGLSSTPAPVVGATVTITGVVGYDGSTPISGSATVITDANGCYAIVPAGWTSSGTALTTPDCPDAVADAASIQHMTTVNADGKTEQATLETDRISVAVAAMGKLTQSYPVTSSVITGSNVVRVIPSVSVLPQPVSISPLFVSIAGPAGFAAPDPTELGVQVQSAPALASGVKFDAGALHNTPDGYEIDLAFSDRNLPAPSGMPGRYGLLVTLPNFVSVRADLLCEMGGSCSFVKPGTNQTLTDGLLVLRQLPSISGTIPAPALPSGNPDWGSAVLNQISGPSQLGNIAVVAKTGDPLTGVVTFDGADSVLAAAGGIYVFRLTVPGYDPESITVNCGADYTATQGPGGCSLLTPATGKLTKLPTFVGRIQLSAPTGVSVPASAASVTAVDTVNASNTITITVDPDGTLHWSDGPNPADLVAPGNYAITVTAPGFASLRVPFSCTAGATCGPTQPTSSMGSTCNTAPQYGVLLVCMLPQITGSISLGAPVAGVAVTSTDITPTKQPSTAGDISAVVTDTSGTVTFTDQSLPAPGTNGLPAGLAIPGSYTFTVQLDGYQSTSAQITCGADYTAGCTQWSTTLYPLPTFPSVQVTLNPDTEPLTGIGIPLTSVKAVVTPNPGTISATVDSTGAVIWADSSISVPGELVAPGTYTITYSRDGFTPVTATLTCTSGSTAACTQTLASDGSQLSTVPLKMLPKAGGTVTIPLPVGATSVDLSNARVTVNSPLRPSLQVSLSQPTYTEPDGVTPNTDTAGEPAAQATLIWNDSALPFAGIVVQGTYTITITVPGYQNDKVTPIDCTQVTTADCSFPGTIELTLNPQPVTSMTILPPLVAPIFTVTPQNQHVSLTSDASGNLTWKQGNLPTGVVNPGTYSITVTLPQQMSSYQLVVDGAINSTGTFSFVCSTDDPPGCMFPDVVLTAPTIPVIEAVGAGGQDVTDAKIVLSHGGTVVGSPNHTPGYAQFAAQSTAAVGSTGTDTSYSLNVDAAGFAFRNGLGSSSPDVQCTNGTQTVSGFQLIPGGTTTCIVTLSPLGTISGRTQWAMNDLNGDRISTESLPDITITATLLDAGNNPTSTVFSGTSGSDGQLTITGTTADEGLGSGTWKITASAPSDNAGALDGFETLTGTIQVGTDFKLVDQTDNGDGISVSGGTVALVFTPNTVDLQVHLQRGSDLEDVLPDAVVTLTDNAGTHHSWACTSPAGAVGDATACTIINNDTDGHYLNFAGVWPGNYTVDVTFPNGNYTDIAAQPLAVNYSDAVQQAPFTIVEHASTLTGSVRDVNGKAVPGATVQLCIWQGSCSVTDFDGNTIDAATTTSTGTFEFDSLPDGQYQLKITHTGYVDYYSGPISAVFGVPIASQDVQLVTATRNVTFTLKGPAGIQLSGATATLTQTSGTTGNNGRVSRDDPVSNLQILGEGSTTNPFTVTANALPTGVWSVSVTGQLNAPYSIATTTNLTVPDTGTISSNLTLNESAATLSVGWPDNSCRTAGADPGPTGLTITVTQDGDATGHAVATSVSTDSGTATATATVYLPPNDYTWAPTATTLPTGWTSSFDGTQDGSFTVATGSTASGSATLKPVQAPLTVTMTVDGAPFSATTAISATDTDDPASPVTGTLAAPLCVTVDGTWTVSADTAAGADPQILLGSASTSPAVMSPNGASATLTGYSFTPTVSLASVPGRPADSHDVAINLYAGTAVSGTAIWSVDPTIWSAAPTSPSDAETSYTGPELVLPQQTYSLRAASGDEFGTVTASGANSIDISAVHAKSFVVSYVKTWASITVYQSDGTTPVPGAAVTLDPSDGAAAVNPAQTDATGVLTWYDLTPSTATTTTTYTATATWTDSGNTKHTGVALFSTGLRGTGQDVTVTLDEVDVPVTVTVDGTQTGGIAVTATKGSTTVGPVTTDANGQAMLRLAPGTGWIFSASGTLDSNPVRLTSTATTVAADGSTTVALAGITVTATIRQQTVTGRPKDSSPSSIGLVLCAGTSSGCSSPVWSGSVDLTFGASASTTQTLVLTDRTYVLTATPPTGSPFQSRDVTVKPSTDSTPTATMNYAKVWFGVTVSEAGSDLTTSDPVAAVTIKNAAGTQVASGSTGTTTATAGEVNFYDLDSSSKFTVTATGTGSDSAYSGSKTVNSPTAGAAGNPVSVNMTKN
jgi:hypothetical protein